MAYSRKASKMTRYRGGFTPSFRRKASSFVKRAASVGGSLLMRRARSNPRYRQAFSIADAIAGQPVESAISGLLKGHTTSSGVVLPKLGVLTSPRLKSSYFKITNNGTGITRTRYDSGSAKPVPKSIYTNAYKQTYVLSDGDSNFTVPNSGIMPNATRGVAQYGFLEILDLKNLIGAFPSSVTSKSPLGSFYFGNTKSVMSITSATNLNCSLRVYECVAKRDTNISYYRTPIDAWSRGIDETVGSSTSTTYTSIGVYPSTSPIFREFWHVENYFDIDLAAGGTHIHTSTYHVNSTIPNCLVSEHGDTSAMAGVTRYYLFVLSGTPVHDSANENNVALGSVKVDVNIVQTYEYYSIPFTDEGLVTSLSSDLITTGEVVTDSDFIETQIIN